MTIWSALRSIIADCAFTVFIVFLPALLMLASIVEVMLPKSVAERWLGVGSGV